MLQINSLNKSFGGQSLFEDASMVMSKGERVGLVGRNGSGKSTLFKMVLGTESYDGGEITLPKNYKLGHLSQHIHFTEKTVLAECSLGFSDEEAFEKSYMVGKILSGLGFSKDDLDKDPSSFSGGYQVRINLAKALLGNPDLLLLDEPTNYLDILSLRWLRQFLKRFEGEVLLITHDRDFMDSVVTHTMGIFNKKLKKIPGNTSKLYEQVASDAENYEKTRVNLEKRRSEIQGFVDRFKAKATKAKQAQSRMKLLEKMGSMDEIAPEKLMGLQFTYAPIEAKTLMTVENLSFGWTKESQALFENLNFVVGRNDRIGIIGKNGKGKSTLLNVIAGHLQARAGEAKEHSMLKMGHFGQTNVERLDPEMTIEEEIRSSDLDASHTKVRSICGAMMFTGDLAKKKIRVLSGGEKSRVSLGKILAHPCNLLLLDEPTNHLDMESNEILAEEIKDFPGAVMIVTHSEMFLNEVCDRLIIFHEDKVELFEGNYQEFLEKIGWGDEKSQSTNENSKPKAKVNNVAEEQALKRKRNNILAQMELVEIKISKIEEIIGKLEQLMVEASSKNEVDRITDISKQLSEMNNTIEKLFLELEELENEKNLLPSK